VAEVMSKVEERIVSRLACTGCGFVVPDDEPYPFRCPQARDGDDIDQVLSRVLNTLSFAFPVDGDPHPFIRYRQLLHVWHFARAREIDDDTYVALIRELDQQLSQVAGRGLCITPFLEHTSLAQHLGSDVAALFVKDETQGVAGSHKARHLFGLLVQLEIIERLGLSGDVRARAPLAIASCGNAALAAALLARAVGRRLRAYLPSWAAPDVLARLEELGAEAIICQREPGVAGDPSYLAFRAALTQGEIPFCCQGTENGLTLDGGRTLAYEIISALVYVKRPLDRVFLQVGGGAVASSFIQAFREAHEIGVITGPLPRFHAVQTVGNAPLARAYDCVAARILKRGVGGEQLSVDRQRTAKLLSTAVAPEIIADELKRAARERSSFMWPWEQQTPSVATGILDDETYDWWAVVRGMMESGGFPVLVGEEIIQEASLLAKQSTPTNPSATGVAGLAGALQLARMQDSAMTGETVAVVFTGSE
jgi:threonine synthase